MVVTLSIDNKFTREYNSIFEAKYALCHYRYTRPNSTYRILDEDYRQILQVKPDEFFLPNMKTNM